MNRMMDTSTLRSRSSRTCRGCCSDRAATALGACCGSHQKYRLLTMSR